MRSGSLVLVATLAVVALATVLPAQVVQTPLAGSAIPQFVDALPNLAVSGGPIETLVADDDEIELHMREFQASVMPSTFVPAAPPYAGTWVWGYKLGPTAPVGTQATYTGPAIVATRGQPTQFRFVNNLGNTATSNVLAYTRSVDQTLHWADPLGGEMNHGAHMTQPMMPPMPPYDTPYAGPIPACVHLHGGDVPPVLDGGPGAWFLSEAPNTLTYPMAVQHGHGYYTHPNVPVAANEAVYRYPNGQEAAPTWFHDHTLGATRLNVYAGLAGAYDIIDPNLVLPAGLHPLGLQQTPVTEETPVEFLTPLVIQDRMFDTNGQLYYPAIGINPEHPFWVPEFVGDTIVVNGKVWPYLTVQAKRYRFLIINGSNARTYELFTYNFATATAGPPIWQIGTDGGYLDAPVNVAGKLVLMPGERADVIIDFAGFGGQTLILRNTGKTPYPGGAQPNPATVGKIVQFRVQPGVVANTSYNPAAVPVVPIRTGTQKIVRLADPLTGLTAPGVVVNKTRQLTLNEVMGMKMRIGAVKYPGGPLEILVNNTRWDGKQPGGVVRPDFTGITLNGITDYFSEMPNEGDTEVWEIVNLTADAHPIHLHLVQFQLLSRQPFKVSQYNTAYAAAFPGGLYIPAYGPPLDYNTGNLRALGGNPDIVPFLYGAAVPPLPNEAGWKDTVQAPPGTVTRFVVRWAPQHRAINAADLNFDFDPFALGYGYVWHCHIIDHEDNEMMRPDAVVPKPGAIRTYIQGEDY